MRTPEFDSTDLAHLQSQLHAWRSRQTGRPRLPQPLWQAAAVLACSHGVSCVARTLRLGYRRLRQLTEAFGSKDLTPPKVLSRIPPRSPGFVELRLPAALAAGLSATPPRGVIELSGPSQRRLRIEMDVDADLCVRLIENFWRSEP